MSEREIKQLNEHASDFHVIICVSKSEAEIKRLHYELGYFQLNINASDFFGNLLNLNQQHRREWNSQLREGEDRSQWLFNTYDTNMAVHWYWDEIIVPAGTSGYC